MKRYMLTVIVFSFMALNLHAEEKKKGSKASAEDAEEGASRSGFLPDWGTPSFGFGVGPIAGYRQQRSDETTSKSTTHQSEFGVQAYVAGVPVVPGNPGVYVRPQVGYVWGRIDGEQTLKATGLESDIKQKYSRYWAGVDTSVFYHWYRHTLGLTYGRKQFDSDNDANNLASIAIENDFGVKLVPLISGHYTHRYLQAKFDDYSAPFLREHDNWIHAKFAIELLDWSIDFGPGFTFATEIQHQGDDANEKTYKGQTDYLKLVGYFDIFWKLYASAYGKYVYNSSSKEIGASAGTQLPSEGLYDPNSVVMPEDSLNAIELIGIHDLFLGLGVAYQMQQQIFNMSEKDGKKRKEIDDEGIILTYQVRF